MVLTVLLWLLAAALVAALIALLLAGRHFFKLALDRPGKRPGLPPAMPKEEPARSWRAEAFENAAWYLRRPFKTLNITARDGKPLNAIWLPADQPTDRAAVVVHGWTSKKEDMATYARLFIELGYHVLMPDLRGHGESEVRYSGFGWLDRLDVVDWIHEAERLGGKRIALLGISMGAATVMNVTGEPLPDTVRCAIPDCGFSSMKEEFQSFLQNALSAVPRFVRAAILFSGDVFIRVRAGFRIDDASCVKQVAKSKTPTLFIHGMADTFVPYAMVDQVYEACAAPKQVLRVPDAAHAQSWDIAPEAYEKALHDFLAQYIGE